MQRCTQFPSHSLHRRDIKTANQPGNLANRLKVLTRPALFEVDEVDCLPVSQDGAILFLQLINACRTSTQMSSHLDCRGIELRQRLYRSRRRHRKVCLPREPISVRRKAG